MVVNIYWNTWKSVHTGFYWNFKNLDCFFTLIGASLFYFGNHRSVWTQNWPIMSNLTSEILSNLNEKQHNSYVFRCKEVQVHSEKVYIQWITHIPNKWASRNVLRKNKYNFNNACISQNSTVRHQTFICSVRTECVGANVRHQGWNKSEDLITEESKRKLIAMAGRLVFQSNQ